MIALLTININNITSGNIPYLEKRVSPKRGMSLYQVTGFSTIYPNTGLLLYPPFYYLDYVAAINW